MACVGNYEVVEFTVDRPVQWDGYTDTFTAPEGKVFLHLGLTTDEYPVGPNGTFVTVKYSHVAANGSEWVVHYKVDGASTAGKPAAVSFTGIVANL